MLLFADTKEIVERFIKNRWNPENFKFVVVSESIDTDYTYDVVKIPQIGPTVSTINQYLDGDIVRADGDYLSYLMNVPVNDTIVATIVKESVIDKKKIIFVNTPTETDQIDYFKTLRGYIETVYNTPTYKLKDLEKNKIKNLSKEQIDEITHIMITRVDKNARSQERLSETVDEILNPEKYRKLEKKKKKEKKRRKKEKKLMRQYNPFI